MPIIINMPPTCYVASLGAMEFELQKCIQFRIYDHRGYINNFIDKATSTHFTLPGHSLANLRVTAIEQIKTTNSNEYRNKREEYFIRKFDTENKGMNRKYY